MPTIEPSRNSGRRYQEREEATVNCDDTLIKRCLFRRWNRQQKKNNKRGPFYHQFLVSELLPRNLEVVGGSVQGTLVMFPKGTHVFQNIRGPVYLLSNGNSFTRGHRYELNLSGWYPMYYWEQRQEKLQALRKGLTTNIEP